MRREQRCAASAAYLHPLADAHQVKHILGAAAHAARAAELIAGDDRDVGAEHIEQARRRATPAVVEVLKRYPAAPPGGGRNTKCPELGFSAVLGSGASEVRFELTTLS